MERTILKGGKNKMKKNIGMFAIALFSVMLMTSFVFAQDFGLGDEDKEERKAFMEEVKTSIENNDYSTWKSLMESQLTQENFDKLVERHEKRSEVRDLMDGLKEAREAGDEDRVEELREELQDLRPDRDGSNGKGHRRGFFKRVKGFFGR